MPHRHLAYLLFAAALSLTGPAQGEPFLDDTAIRKQFLEQILALRNAKNPAGLSAADLRSQLRKQKTGNTPTRFPPRRKKILTRQQLYELAKESTFIVGHIYQCGQCDDWHTNLATGVAISEAGIIATNYHVLQFRNAAIFAAMDHRQRLFPIRAVFASDRDNDLAVIELETTAKFTAAPPVTEAQVGDEISIVSHPDAHFYSFTTGTISRFSIDPKTRTQRLETSAAFGRGSSGSGMFDRSGNLIGIASTTNAIYYEEEETAERNLQMVIHTGIPSVSLLQLLPGSGTGEP